mgnify:CR=1 FL=1
MSKPVNRFELIDRLFDRMSIEKAAGNELMHVELWEMAWLLAPMKFGPDTDGTGEIAFDFEPVADATQRHVVQVRHVEDYLVQIDVNAETQPYKEAGQE